MSWSEIKKAVNSDLSTPLNTLINNRPKGYKLVLDSVESGEVTRNTSKTFSSSTGGVLYFSAGGYIIGASGVGVSVDGTVINIKSYMYYYGGSNENDMSTFVIPYNSNVTINNAGLSNSIRIKYNTSNYKNVPIT